MRQALLNIRDPRWCASWRAGVMLIALCVAVYVPGLAALPVIDRDEARFAQASRQMFESVALPEAERDAGMHSGGLVVPMVQERERLNKPPLIYWLQAGAAALFTGGEPARDAIWMYRVPSLLAAMASVLVTWRVGVSMFDPRAALLAGVILAVCPLWVWEARQARADHVMTACTAGAMWGLWEVWRRGRDGPGGGRTNLSTRRLAPHHNPLPVAECGDGERGPKTPDLSESSSEGPDSPGVRSRPSSRSLLRSGVSGGCVNTARGAPMRWAVLLWVCVALGMLAKGPITPMVVVLSAVFLSAFTRGWGWLRMARPVLGTVIVVAAVTPWVVLLSERYGLARYLTLVYDETIGRAGSARESHFGPPGYHFILLIASFWPGSIVTGMAVARGWTRTVRGIRPWKWRAARLVRSRAAELFCLAWVLPAWVVFEVSATKLPHYPMPLFPALALLSARTVLAVSAGRVPRAWGRLAGTVYVLWLGVTAAIGIGAVGASLVLFDGTWQGVVGLALPLGLVLLTLQIVLFSRIMWSLSKRRIARAVRGAVWMAVIAWVLALGLIVPRAPSLWATRALVRSLEGQGWRPGDPLASRYREGSLVFGARGRVLLAESPAELQEFVGANAGALGVIRARDLHLYTGIAPVAMVRAFNIGRTERESLLIVRSVQPLPRPAGEGPHADEPGGPP